MDYGFSKEQEMLKKAARQFAETKVAPRVLEIDDKGEFPFDLVRQMGQMGLIGLVNSKQYGGTGMGHLSRMVVIEEMARATRSLGFFFQAGNLLTYARRTSALRSRRSATSRTSARGPRSAPSLSRSRAEAPIPRR